MERWKVADATLEADEGHIYGRSSLLGGCVDVCLSALEQAVKRESGSFYRHLSAFLAAFFDRSFCPLLSPLDCQSCAIRHSQIVIFKQKRPFFDKNTMKHII